MSWITVPSTVTLPARGVAATLLSLCSAFACSSSHAGLGEPVASVARDHAAFHGKALSVTHAARYDLHDITTERGGHVREYASPDGTVFAVAWDGPDAPDLRTILGSGYDGYVTAARQHRGSHHVLSMSSDSLVFTVRRLPRGFAGSARLPALVPSGTDPKDLE